MRGQVGAPVSRRRLVSKGKRMKVKPRLMYVVWLLCRSLWAGRCVVALLLYFVEVGLFEWLYAVLVDGDFEAGAGVAAGAYEVGLRGIGVD